MYMDYKVGDKFKRSGSSDLEWDCEIVKIFAGDVTMSFKTTTDAHYKEYTFPMGQFAGIWGQDQYRVSGKRVSVFLDDSLFEVV